MDSNTTKRPLVLVVDDERAVLDEVTAALAEADIACHCCRTPEEAIIAAKATRPQLILCDVNLHGESGFDTYERIKQQPGLDKVPVMFLSGMQLPDVIRRHSSSGGMYCLRKPFDHKVLIRLVDQAISVPPPQHTNSNTNSKSAQFDCPISQDPPINSAIL